MLRLRTAMLAAALLPLCAATLLFASGERPVAIGTIVSDPEPFHMKEVLLQGTVRQVLAIEPYYLASGAGCYGAYRLTLEDATGSLPVAVLGVCGTPFIRLPPAEAEEHVLVRGQIHAPGHVGTFYGADGRPLPDANPDELHLVAAEIIHEHR